MRLNGIKLALHVAATNEVAGLPGQLKVLVADRDSGRMTALEQRLREISDAVILGVPAGSTLIEAAATLAPDVIIVHMARPDRDALDDLRPLLGQGEALVAVGSDSVTFLRISRESADVWHEDAGLARHVGRRYTRSCR